MKSFARRLEQLEAYVQEITTEPTELDWASNLFSIWLQPRLDKLPIEDLEIIAGEREGELSAAGIAYIRELEAYTPMPFAAHKQGGDK